MEDNSLYHCVDNGKLEVIGKVTIHSASVNLYRCSVCGKEFDDSNYESIATLKDCAEMTNGYYPFLEI